MMKLTLKQIMTLKLGRIKLRPNPREMRHQGVAHKFHAT